MGVTNELVERLDIRLKGGSMKEMNMFRYSGVDLSVDGYMKGEVNHKSDEGKKVGDVLRHL